MRLLAGWHVKRFQQSGETCLRSGVHVMGSRNLITAEADPTNVGGGHAPPPLPMGIDSDFSDTLMHVSGSIMRGEIVLQIKPFKNADYIAPGTRSETSDE